MPAPRKHRLAPEQTAAIARAIADPRRFGILQQIAGQPVMPCSALAEQEMLSPATISHHIKELHEAGLVEIAREGRCSHLSLNRETWDAYLAELAAL